MQGGRDADPGGERMICRMLARVTRMPYSDDSNRCRHGRPTGTLTVPRSPPSRPSPAAAGWDTKLHRSLARGFVRLTLCRPLLRDVLGPVPACAPVLAFFLVPVFLCVRSLWICRSLVVAWCRQREPASASPNSLSQCLLLSVLSALASSPLPLSFLFSLFYVS